MNDIDFKELSLPAFRSRKRGIELGDALPVAQSIIADVKQQGAAAVRRWAEKLGDVQPHQDSFANANELQHAFEQISAQDQQLLKRTYQRIFDFACRQKSALSPLDFESQGCRMGHGVFPIESVACYVPGGRFPLVSSLLMTVATAQAAGVERIVVLNPRPATVTLAAAHLCGVKTFLKIGGAQAIAAAAYGYEQMSRCDMVVGPGNRYVTAAKAALSSEIGIDMVAGPSELVVVCDGSADLDTVAADLLGQAEHDPDAVPVVIAIGGADYEGIKTHLLRRLRALPTAQTAAAALKNGGFIRAKTIEEAAQLCNEMGPEHLELCVADAPRWAPLFRCYGGLFVGHQAAEVLGDYGAGPNHVLPTAGTARWSTGLSVFHFLKTRTFIEVVDSHAVQGLVADSAALARLEGLEAHAQSAERRLLL